MIAANPALDRVRRIASWSAEREPRTLWLRARDDLAFTIAAAFVCLGVERILLQFEAGFAQVHAPEARIVGSFRRWLQRVEVEQVPLQLDPLTLELMLETHEVDVVVEASDDPALRAASVALGIPHYSVVAGGSRLAFAMGEAAEDVDAGTLPVQLEAAFAAAGLVSHDFAWRHVLDPPRTLPGSRFRFDLGDPFAQPPSGRGLPRGVLSAPMSVLLVGAGGLGCPAGLCLSRRLPRGSRVVVCDYDHVDATNSRQFLYRQSDIVQSRPKATAFCREMEHVAPHVAWVPCVRALPHPEIAAFGPFDVSLAFTDNLRSRADLDRMELAPLLVHAAVDPESATAGLFRQDSVRLCEALLLDGVVEQERGRASCAEADPSIVSTNFIGAALGLSQLWSHLTHGPLPTELVSYEIGTGSRGGRWPAFRSAQRATAPGAVGRVG